MALPFDPVKTPQKAKVMIAFPFVEGERFGISLGDACASGLEALGLSVVKAGTTFHTDKRHAFRIAALVAKCAGIAKHRMPWMERNRLHRALCRLIEQERPDYLLTISTIALDQRTIDFARKHDHYFTQFDDPRFIKLDTLGYAPGLYRPINNVGKDVPVAFVGRHETRREHYLNNLAETGLAIYGPRWDTLSSTKLQACVRENEIWGDEINLLYNRSKIVLNIPSWAPTYADTPNLRLVDVPASGAFLLTEDSEATRRFFTPGEHIDVFSSPEELSDKVRFYLEHEDVREKIARAGHKHVQELGTYQDKMRYLLDCCGIVVKTTE